jgi:hypothetical protein
VADLRPPVAGAPDYVPRPRARWTAASAGLRGHTEPLCFSRPPVWVTAAAAAVPVGRPGPRMEPLARRRLGLAVTDQLLHHHDAPPAPYLSPGLGGRLRRVRNRTLNLIEREDDTRSWGNFLASHSTTMPCPPRVGDTYL